MYRSRPAACLRVVPVLVLVSLGAATTLSALANRVFVSALSGNDANSCDNIATPCKTFAGAVLQLNPDGEAIVLDSGGYGPVTITKALTLEAPSGVVAFIHPSSGDAVTINAGAGDTVVLRGLVLNSGPNNGILVSTVGALFVENCAINNFSNGIRMLSAGKLSIKNTDIKGCDRGVGIENTSGVVMASIDHCHLDGNVGGFRAATISPGGSTTTATYSTANNNGTGWVCGAGGSTGIDVLNLEFCSSSENNSSGLNSNSTNALTAARYSNCVFANNGQYGAQKLGSGTVESRGNNTITGNGLAPTSGAIGTFAPL